MESGNGFVLWALLKMNGRGDGQEELFLIYKKLRLRDEAMACERCLGQLLGESSDQRWTACWEMGDIWWVKSVLPWGHDLIKS